MANDETREVNAAQATAYIAGNRELLRALDIAPSEAGSIEARRLAQGEHNANFRFARPSDGKRFVLRVNYATQLGLTDQIGYEYDALRFLERSGCTPRAYYVDRSKSFSGHGTLVMEFYEGSWMDFHRAADLKQAAQMMADVHSVKADGRSPFLHPKDPLRAQFEECRGYVRTYRASDLQNDMVNRHLDLMLDVAARALDTPLYAADTYHVLNTEAVPSHFLIPDDGSRGHFLDWERSLLGEATQDLAYFMSPTTTIWDTDFIFDMDQREAFVQEYLDAVDGRFSFRNFRERFDAYVIMNCLRGVTWSCAAWVEYHDPARPLKNEKTYTLLKTYLSEEYLELIRTRHFS